MDRIVAAQSLQKLDAVAWGSATDGQILIYSSGTGKMALGAVPLTGDGSGLTNLNASNIASGTLNAARLPSGINATLVGGGGVDNTEFGYLDGVTSAIQTQLNGKASSSHTHSAADITSGSLDDARLSSNVPLKNAANIFSAAQTIRDYDSDEANGASAIAFKFATSNAMSTAAARIAAFYNTTNEAFGIAIGPAASNLNLYLRAPDGSTSSPFCRIYAGPTGTGTLNFIGGQMQFTGEAIYGSSGQWQQSGSATSTATQKTSSAAEWRNSVWTGSAAANQIHRLTNTASTSTNLESMLLFEANRSNVGGGSMTDMMALWYDGATTTRVGIGTRTPAEKLSVSGNFALITAGNGIKIKEGTNATAGVATLVGGTVTVSTTKVTASSRIFCFGQNTGTAPGELTISARTAGTSFTITSTSGTDDRDVAWWILEPA